MLSRETLERYRQMTLSERAQLVLEMMRDNFPSLLVGSREVVDRKFELLRRQNDERSRRMLAGIARSKAVE